MHLENALPAPITHIQMPSTRFVSLMSVITCSRFFLWAGLANPVNLTTIQIGIKSILPRNVSKIHVIILTQKLDERLLTRLETARNALSILVQRMSQLIILSLETVLLILATFWPRSYSLTELVKIVRLILILTGTNKMLLKFASRMSVIIQKTLEDSSWIPKVNAKSVNSILIQKLWVTLIWRPENVFLIPVTPGLRFCCHQEDVQHAHHIRIL